MAGCCGRLLKPRFYRDVNFFCDRQRNWYFADICGPLRMVGSMVILPQSRTMRAVTRIINVAVTSNNVSYAKTDSTNHGLIEGTYGDTYWPNVSSQSITETAYRNGTRSRLSHQWQFDLPGGENGTQFFVYAAHSSSNEHLCLNIKWPVLVGRIC